MTEMQINYRNYQETKRHNIETERLTGEAQAEIKRANLAREAETYRSNVATLNETIRANQAREQLQQQQNVINQSHYQRMDSETQRANIAREIETSTHNENVELETAKHNRMTESLQQIATTSQSNVNAANVGLTNAKTQQTRLQNVQQKIINQYAPAQQAFDTYSKGVNAVDRTVGVVDNVIKTVNDGLNLFGVRQRFQSLLVR